MIGIWEKIVYAFIISSTFALGQLIVPITIMSYNTSDDDSNWTNREPNLKNVIGSVNPDLFITIEVNNSNTGNFLTIC